MINTCATSFTAETSHASEKAPSHQVRGVGTAPAPPQHDHGTALCRGSRGPSWWQSPALGTGILLSLQPPPASSSLPAPQRQGTDKGWESPSNPEERHWPPAPSTTEKRICKEMHLQDTRSLQASTRKGKMLTRSSVS